MQRDALIRGVRPVCANSAVNHGDSELISIIFINTLVLYGH